MRITVDIPISIMEELKSIQTKEWVSLDDLVAGLLAEGLQARYADQTGSELDWKSQSMGARVDLTDKEAVYAVIDADVY